MKSDNDLEAIERQARREAAREQMKRAMNEEDVGVDVNAEKGDGGGDGCPCLTRPNGDDVDGEQSKLLAKEGESKAQ